MRLPVAIILAVVSSAHPVWAQSTPTLGTTGLYLIPSFRVSESFDDNIFGSSSNRQSDFISRFYPGLQGGYRSEPLTLLATGGFEADVFAKHPEQNDVTAGWNAGLNLRYAPIRRLTFGTNISYTETKSLPTLNQVVADLAIANPLNPANTLLQGRLKTTLLSVSSSGGYQFTPRTAGNAAFSYTQSTQEAGASNTAYGAQIGLSHHFTQRDIGTFADIQNVFESPGTPTRYTNAPTIGWTRRLTPLVTLSLQAGPQFSFDGNVGAYANASLTYDYKVADYLVRASLTYLHAEGFVVGQAGPTTTETIASRLAFAPFRLFEIDVGTTTSRFSGSTTSGRPGASSTAPHTTTYGLTAGASYRVFKWLTARTSYGFYYQQQSVGGDIPHNIVLVGVNITYPFRVDE